MQIWIWILATILLTQIFLRRKIRLEHYIWMLLPIDMYGIDTFGFTVKPYMIFCLLLTVRLFYRYGGRFYIGSTHTTIGILLCCLAFVANSLNNNQVSSIMASAMVLIVILCCLSYISNISDTYDDIPEVLIASSIGYGIVYTVAYVALSLGVTLPGICALSRMDTGIFMQFNNMYKGTFIQEYRLRGFSIDPNVVIGTFAPAFAIALPQVLLRKANWRSYLSILLSVISVILTGSRMALIILAIIVLLSLIIVFREMPKSKRGTYVALAVFFAFILLLIALASDIADRLVTNLFGAYTNRAGLSDEYGRFSIWKEAWSVLWSHNVFLGLGTGQLQYLSIHGLAAHNTWLEWVCGCGILVGTGIVIYFFYTSIWLWKKSKAIHITDTFFFASQGLTLGALSIVAALVSVDNVTNSNLWFLCFTGQALFDFVLSNQTKLE